MTGVLNIALVQTRTPATAKAGLDHVAPLIREAAAGGARFILTPEGTNLLEQRRDRRATVLASEDEDVAVLGLRRLAAELGVWLLIGSAIVRSGRDGDARAANRSLLVGAGGAIVARYDKLHVFDVDLPNGERYRESAAVRPGDGAAVADTPWGRLGLTICYDIRFPHLHRQLAQSGASMIAVPAAFTAPTGEAHWETLLRARAIETGAFVLQSYLDAVMQGFFALYGEAGVRRFVEETEGFETTLLCDRERPLYPRSVTLHDGERALFDELVAERGMELRPASNRAG